jgi:hypothetical protein
LLKKIYKFHIENFKCIDNSDALFVNRSGHAMTDVVYRYHFNKLRDKFISRLLNSNDIVLKTMGIDLQSRKWSSHIGRGIFSNMIADVSNNIAQIAQARGDSNLQSSLVYLSDSEKMAKLLYENETFMWNELIKTVNLGGKWHPCKIGVLVNTLCIGCYIPNLCKLTNQPYHKKSKHRCLPLM